MKIVFLYTELAAYTLACFQNLVSSGAQILVYRYPVNKEAPFKFKDQNAYRILDRKEFSTEQIISEIAEFDPQLILCSGWIDKEYVKVCGHFKKKRIKTVLCLDNHWRFSPKQVLAVFASPFFIKPNFELAWVPGKIQRKFVSKLGFKKKNIYEQFYCADTSFYSAVFKNSFAKKKDDFPKRFIYVGRYYEFKGLNELWGAFEKFSVEFPEWELWCIGTGDLASYQHPKIKHFGFVQPEKMEEILAQAGVFVLPSRFEPWGVVVHEMAAAGFPLLLSNEVGAGETFLIENENGFRFRKNDEQQLAHVFKRIAQMTNAKLTAMSEKSHELSKKISLQTWTETVKKMITN